MSTTVSQLADKISGHVVDADHEAWDTARQAWNLAVNQHPAFVVRAASNEDVAVTVRYAADHGLRVAPQATGHLAASLGDLADTILLRTDQLRAVDIHPASRTVRVQAGTQWADVSPALAPYGLVGLSGSAADIGVVGYTLGGGFSWFGREHGLACNSVTAIDLVTGDGRAHRVTADNEPDLFWATRGGGGNTGVVTGLEFTAYPAEQVYAGALLFPITRARDVLATFASWTATLPDSATTCARLLRLPPLPELPTPLRGQAFVGLDGVFNMTSAEAEELLAPMRQLGPTMDNFAPIPASATAQIHMDPPQPVPGCGDGMVLSDLNPDTIDAILSVAGPGIDSPLLAVDIRQLGGAIGRPRPDGGAVNHLPGAYMLYGVGIAPAPPARAAVMAALAALSTALQPWRTGRDYMNFREALVDPHRFYDDDVLGRLHDIRQLHDPGQVIRAGHDWSRG